MQAGILTDLEHDDDLVTSLLGRMFVFGCVFLEHRPSDMNYGIL